MTLAKVQMPGTLARQIWDISDNLFNNGSGAEPPILYRTFSLEIDDDCTRRLVTTDTHRLLVVTEKPGSLFLPVIEPGVYRIYQRPVTSKPFSEVLLETVPTTDDKPYPNWRRVMPDAGAGRRIGSWNSDTSNIEIHGNFAIHLRYLPTLPNHYTIIDIGQGKPYLFEVGTERSQPATCSNALLSIQYLLMPIQTVHTDIAVTFPEPDAARAAAERSAEPDPPEPDVDEVLAEMLAEAAERSVASVATRELVTIS